MNESLYEVCKIKNFIKERQFYLMQILIICNAANYN